MITEAEISAYADAIVRKAARNYERWIEDNKALVRMKLTWAGYSKHLRRKFKCTTSQ